MDRTYTMEVRCGQTIIRAELSAADSDKNRLNELTPGHLVRALHRLVAPEEGKVTVTNG